MTDPYESAPAVKRNAVKNQCLVPYKGRRIWCDLHRTSTHDYTDCREQLNGGSSYPTRRPMILRPHYGRPPVVDTNMIGNMFQQQLVQAVSSMVNGNDRCPAESPQPVDYVQKGAPGTEHSDAHRYGKPHCFYRGKGYHYMTECPAKRADDERSMMAAGWIPQVSQGSTALAIMGGPSTGGQPQTVHYMPNTMQLPDNSLYSEANARDTGPQPKMH
ncbi:hypothetical protein EDC01DRAFT_748871 [Geopyxis carbonaria]|nr:hypothetical protein EDC01DRAFT_748871 [Geopyxis carbonaria]